MVRIRNIKKVGTARTQRYQMNSLPQESGLAAYVKSFILKKSSTSFKMGWGLGNVMCVLKILWLL